MPFRHLRFGLVRVRSPLLAQSLVYFLFLRVLRCFSSPGSPLPKEVPESLPAGCPIRKSADLRIFAPPRSLSQLITSFIASESQGILHVPLSPFSMTLAGRSRSQTVPSLCFDLYRSSYLAAACAAAGRSFQVSLQSLELSIRFNLLFSRSCVISICLSAVTITRRSFQTFPVCQCPLFRVVPGRVELPTSTLSV